VTRSRAASGAASGSALGAAFHMAPGLAIQHRVRPASGLSSESTRPRLLRRFDPKADVLPAPADSRAELAQRPKPRIRSIYGKAFELERNAPCPGMGLDLNDRQYPPAVRTVPRRIPRVPSQCSRNRPLRLRWAFNSASTQQLNIG
jgi:hypothetical protein